MPFTHILTHLRAFSVRSAQWAETAYQAVIGKSNFFEFDTLSQNFIHTEQNSQRIWILRQNQKRFFIEENCKFSLKNQVFDKFTKEKSLKIK